MMTDIAEHLSQVDDISTTQDRTPGSSVSFTFDGNDILLKEKSTPKPEKNREPPPTEQQTGLWWLKKATTQLDSGNPNKDDFKKTEKRVPSPDVSSATKDFLEKEKMCKNDEAERNDNDDIIKDLLTSVELDRYQSDFESATDEDIGSILDEMSKIANTLSPVPENVKSKSIEEILTEEQRSVEELIQEAEKLVQESGGDLLKGVLKTEIITVPDQDQTASEGLTRVRQLEVDIFKMIEDQVKENSGDVKSDKRSQSTSIEVLFENVKTKKSSEGEKKKLDDQKTEVSSNSDLDDPIEKHSASEDANDKKKVDAKKESLKKEITDVEKDFFDVLIQKTKESAERLSSHSSSLDQEDFTHLLKILQEQSNKEGNATSKASSINLDQFDPLKEKSEANEKKELLERELVSIESKKIVYELESSAYQSTSMAMSKMERLLEENARKDSSRQSSRGSSKKSSTSAKSSQMDVKKVINDKNELYTVGLTPRLELFADAIPKLLAEKSNEASARKDDEAKSENSKQVTPKSDDNEDFSFKNFKALDVIKYTEVLNDHKNVKDVKDYDLINLQESQMLDYRREHHDYNYFQSNTTNTGLRKSSDQLKTERVTSAPDKDIPKGDTHIGKSRSYDQLSKPSISKFGSSLESVRTGKVLETRKQVLPTPPKKMPTPKTKIQSRTVTKVNPKTKIPPRGSRREPMRPLQNEFSLDVRGNQIKYEETPRTSLGGGDYSAVYGGETLEMLYQEERQRFMHLKDELEAEIETYKSKLKDVQLLNEQEMFSLKKQNILLKAKVDELTIINKKTADARTKYDPKIMSMQKELQRQENVIRTYEVENKRLLQEMKRLQSELKTVSQSKTKVVAADNANNNHELFEKLKDLQEDNVKLNLENEDLKRKNSDISLKNEDVVHQNSLLQEELEMIKDQLRAKNDYINDRLQAMTTNELELRKQVEELNLELHSKTEQLKSTKLDYERFQETVDPLEKELLDLRTKCTYYQEKLQTAKINCEREKDLTQKLKNQVIVDNKNIVDLTRQVREMERILKRKNPDSVSALILTANSENEKLNCEKVKLLEDRITFLENEIKAKEDMAQVKLSDIHRKFSDMREKYLSQVTDLEQKLKVPTPIERKVSNDAGTQTIPQRLLEHRGSEPNLAEKLNNNRPGPKSQNTKEDTHLLATIRGLKLELTSKEKIVTKVSKELSELQKTNRKLQKEREKLLNERKNLEKVNKVMTSSDSKLSSLKNLEDEKNSNFYQNGLANGKKFSSSAQKLYDPEGTEVIAQLKKLANENEVLREELSRINKDFSSLKNKRLHDLNLLQEEHEKEIELIVKEYSLKAGDTKALKLQGQVNSQMAMISHLKQQIDKLQDYEEQVIIIKAERDHLESKNRMLNEKVKYLSTPSYQQLEVLQDKITILQQRHESRELSLQKLVRDLLRSRNQGCKDCKSVSNVGGKPQSCYYRQELDNILGTLQDLTLTSP